MQENLVNGVPLFDPATGWVQTYQPGAVMRSLREVMRWAEAVFGLTLDARTMDVLMGLCGQRWESPPSVSSVAAATGVSRPVVRQALQRLGQTGLLQAPRAGDDKSPVLLSSRLQLAWRQFEELLDGTYGSRSATRSALFVNRVADVPLRNTLDRLFDRCFDLGWLYLHNWGANCNVAAVLVAHALRAQGLQSRVVVGRVHIHMGERGYDIGGEGYTPPGQFNAHIYNVVEERVLVDFGLGTVRRSFLRGYPWAVALEAPSGIALGKGVVAQLDDARAGHILWRDDWNSAADPVISRQLTIAEGIAERLMPIYAARA